MLILFVIAAISLVLGLLFMLGRGTLKKISDFLNRTIVTVGDETDKKTDIFLGVFLVIFAAVLFIIGLSLKH